MRKLLLLGLVALGVACSKPTDNGMTTTVAPPPEIVEQPMAVTTTPTPTTETQEEEPCVDWVFNDGEYIQILEPYVVYYREDLNPPAANVVAVGNGIAYIYENAPTLVASELLVVPGVIRPGLYTAQAIVEVGDVESTSCHPRRVLLNDHRLLYEHYNDQQRAEAVVYVLTHEYTHVAHSRFLDTPADEELEVFVPSSIGVFTF